MPSSVMFDMSTGTIISSMNQNPESEEATSGGRGGGILMAVVGGMPVRERANCCDFKMFLLFVGCQTRATIHHLRLGCRWQ